MAASPEGVQIAQLPYFWMQAYYASVNTTPQAMEAIFRASEG
jgi:hypothetical protein